MVLIKLNPVAGSLLILIAICFMVSSYFARVRSPKTTQSTTRMKEVHAELSAPSVTDFPKPSQSTMSTNQLSAESPVPSVTERTTNLLEGQRPEGSRTESGSDA